MSLKLDLVIVLTSLALFGAGCLKSAPKPADQAAAQAAAQQAELSNLDAQTPPASPAEALGAILARFRGHKSFRAKMSMPEAKMPLTGSIEFSKPSRMRASINIGDSDVMDIIIAGANAYERANNGQWNDISNLPEGIKLSTVLYGLTSGKTSLSNFAVSKDDKVAVSRDEQKKCDLYVAELKGRDGKLNTVNVCSSGGLVRYVKIDSKDNGPVTFEYYDHDVLFMIERPI